jgi:uncharacterized protein YndB with AHSA1/START domain
VFRAFTAPQALQDWLCDVADVDPRPGGRAYFWWDSGEYAAGTFLAAVPAAALVFTWHGPAEPPGVVRVALLPTDEQTTVAVTVEGSPALALRWEAALADLAGLLATGLDPRQARRPFFGLDSATPLAASAAMGAGPAEGLRLDGLVPGASAAAAGLQPGDVLVAVAGLPVGDFATFRAALAGHEAGDTITIAFYRGTTRHEGSLTLSAHLVVAPPASVGELVALARAGYDVVDAELAACLAGVSTVTADARPTAGGWTIKEIVAHLLALELDVQTWLTVIIEDGPAAWPFHANTTERVAALVAVYGTLPALVAALGQAEAVNLALMAGLPSAPVRRHQLAHLAAHLREGLVDHAREHCAEIAMRAARSPAP